MGQGRGKAMDVRERTGVGLWAWASHSPHWAWSKTRLRSSGSPFRRETRSGSSRWFQGPVGFRSSSMSEKFRNASLLIRCLRAFAWRVSACPRSGISWERWAMYVGPQNPTGNRSGYRQALEQDSAWQAFMGPELRGREKRKAAPPFHSKGRLSAGLGYWPFAPLLRLKACCAKEAR